MKLNSLVLAAATVLFSAVVTAEPVVMKFSIPFAFSADNHQFAAGDYLIRCDAVNNSVTLTMNGDTPHFLTTGIPGSTPDAFVSWRGRMTFHKYGNRYYLHSFERAGDYSREWQPSRAERESAKAIARQELALLLH